MLGTVSVSSKNGYQNTINEVERRFLFIGKTTVEALQNKVTHLDSRTDITSLFVIANGKTSKNTQLKDQLIAAQLNAKNNWTASVIGLKSDGDWKTALNMANNLMSYEAVVLTDPMATKADIEAVSAEMAAVESRDARYMFAMVCTAPILPTQSWSEYEAHLNELVDGVNASRVMCIPTLCENNLGILAGRLCDRSVTIADSPMRVKTGPLLGMGQFPVDKDSAPFPYEMLTALDAKRLSVPQTYPGEHGWYWADGNTLDLDTGDFKVIEHLRIVLKACRNVYKIALPTIADRALNSSPQSIEFNKSLYMKPLLQMAAPVKINNVSFPGEIWPPKDSAVEINWITDKKTEIFVTVRPIDSQKDISIGVGIDLTKQQGDN